MLNSKQIEKRQKKTRQRIADLASLLRKVSPLELDTVRARDLAAVLAGYSSFAGAMNELAHSPFPKSLFSGYATPLEDQLYSDRGLERPRRVPAKPKLRFGQRVGQISREEFEFAGQKHVLELEIDPFSKMILDCRITPFKSTRDARGSKPNRFEFPPIR